MSCAEFRTLTILHTEADNGWCEYIVGKFRSDKLRLKIETLNVTSLDYENPPEIQTAIAESYAVMLLTTCFFLEYMEKEQHWFARMLETRDKSITTVVAATLDVSSDELQEVTDKYNYNTNQEWTTVDISVSGANIMECISTILGITDRNAETLRKRLPARTYSDPSKLNSSEARESIEMIPGSVHKAGEKVVLIFTKEKAQGSVTVHSGDIKIPVETVNPYCVTFKAPEITGTKILLQVDVNNIKFRRLKLYGNRPPEFSSVELMCQSYGVTKKEDLDKKLAEKFTSSMCDDSRAMMVFSDVIKNVPSGKHDGQYPTLLHWAAANGLRELCSVLLSAPGANEACNISNCDDDDVADLAEKYGYEDLSNFITEFTETKKIADACDLYVQCYGVPPDSPPLYEIMSSNVFGRPTRPPIQPRVPQAIKPSTLPPRLNPPTEEGEYVEPEPLLRLAAVGSRSQTELIEIQEEVKNGNFSIKEAEMLFSSWKARYETGNAISFKERQQSLQTMREQHKKAMEMLTGKYKKPRKGFKKKQPVFSKDAITTISDPIGMRRKFGTLMPSSPGPGRGDSGASIGSSSHDSGRYSGRDSNLSQTSTSSEDTELEDGMSIVRGVRSQSERAPGRPMDRQSKRELYLELTHEASNIPESEPPPIPPRIKQPQPAEVKQPPQVKVKPNFTQKPQPPLPSKKPVTKP